MPKWKKVGSREAAAKAAPANEAKVQNDCNEKKDQFLKGEWSRVSSQDVGVNNQSERKKNESKQRDQNSVVNT
jgi:hypothetical protein